MSRKRSYVEAMENGEIEQFCNLDSNNVTCTESVSELNDNDSAKEEFAVSNSEIGSTVYLDEVSLSNESYIESVNEHLQETLIPDQHQKNKNGSDSDCETYSNFKKDSNYHTDEVNNSQFKDLSARKNGIVYLQKPENSLSIQNLDKYSTLMNNCEMSAINIDDGSSSSSEVNDDESSKFRRNTYPVSIERLHILEKENLEEYQQLDSKIETLKSVDEYVVSSTIERFSNNFVIDSQFPNGIYCEPNNTLGNDLLRYDVIEIDREIADNTNTNTSSIQNNTTSGEKDVFPIQYTGRNSVRKKKRNQPENHGIRTPKWKRVIFRNGETNISLKLNIPGRTGKYMKDLVTTLVSGQWRWVIFLLSACHFAIWLAFALMFYVASYANGDMSDKPPAIPCITEGRTFTGIFTFAVETQVSIGYGEKSPTEACPEVIFIMVMEVVAGYLLLGAMVGIVHIKIVRPEKHLKEVGFSKNAVVCLRDGRLSLVVRVWDNKQKHVMSTRVSAWLVKHTPAGPVNYSLKLSSKVIILWPVTLQHIIDKDSPLFDMSAKDLLDTRFEIVITITGACRLTGNVTQSRTSYLPHDVLWGHRFKNVLRFDTNQESFVVDRRLLNSVERVETPLCSAQLLYQLSSGLVTGSPKVSISPMYLSPPGSPASSPPSILSGPIMKFQNKLIRERTL